MLIDWKDIDTLSSDKPLLVRRSGFDNERSERLVAAGSGMVRVQGEREYTLPLAQIKRLVPPGLCWRTVSGKATSMPNWT